MKSVLAGYWAKKSVLITGASSGLGRAITEALAPFGIHFCLLARREEKLRELAEQLGDSGSRFWYRSVDVRDRLAVARAVADFHETAGRLDVAWVNSGISLDTSYRKWAWENVEEIIDVNLRGALYTAKACLDVMVPQGAGALVGIGSAASMRGLPLRGIYSMTKISLAYFWESMSIELPQIQFTMVHPGYVDTPINAGNPNRIWLMPPARAARLMIRAVARRNRVYIFPFRMRLLYRLVRNLPPAVYYHVLRRAAPLAQPSVRRLRAE